VCGRKWWEDGEREGGSDCVCIQEKKGSEDELEQQQQQQQQ